MAIRAEIRKRVGGFSLEIAFETSRGTLGFLGASGSGKSMTLRCVAGIDRPDEGLIEIDGVTVFDSASGVDLPPRLRKAGLLFQGYALFPAMTVRENVEIALRSRLERGVARSRVDGRVDELLRAFALESLARLRPRSLSGGQQQRLALARMLASAPRAVMLDEPFSALDAHLRASVARELAAFIERAGVPSILVSHDRDELYRTCEEILVLDRGSVTARGPRERVFGDPGTLAAARLTGCENLAPAFRAGPRRVAVPRWGLTLETARPVPERFSHVGVRARSVRVARSGEWVNVFPFSPDARAVAPGASVVSVSAMTPPGVAGGERDARDPLLWSIPSEGINTSALPRRLDLVIPPDAILFLS
jgi:molybdate transport system ATP-binding protein